MLAIAIVHTLLLCVLLACRDTQQGQVDANPVPSAEG